MAAVDFGFISSLEGGPALCGYVPDPEQSNSGVTVATGFDLGCRSDSDLVALLPEHGELVDKLARYCGHKRSTAVTVLENCPLHITEAEAKLIDSAVKQQLLNQLQQRYDSAAETGFALLPAAMQTVIASVAFQYGDLAKRCPRFWRAAVAGDAIAMIRELKNFGDRYITRRQREANYLQKFCKAGIA
ncbi:pesticin C-terminus-like muramidase [Rheinheimera sp.]|uniref:pesticin C-terminus-like muramidase n=1 Tax=Rheinheimera sp. TaxID=1869214 RepID=UPI0025DF9FFA|nr:pesticin C-terminus-like muramidase [Rheinheimera sp.]